MSAITLFEVGKIYGSTEYLPNGKLDVISIKTIKLRTSRSILTSDGKVFSVFVSDNCEHAVPYSVFNNGSVIKASDIVNPVDIVIDSDFMDAFLTELETINKTPDNVVFSVSF